MYANFAYMILHNEDRASDVNTHSSVGCLFGGTIALLEGVTKFEQAFGETIDPRYRLLAFESPRLDAF